MKTLGICLLAVSGLAGSVLAQDTQKTQLANDVIKAMNADKMFEPIPGQIRQMVASQTSMFVLTAATPEQKAKIEQAQIQGEALGTEAVKGIVEQMNVIYGEVFSVEELKAMKAFFESPAGKALLAKQPQIGVKLKPVVQQMQTELMPKIAALVEQARPPAPVVTATTEPVSVTTPPVSAPLPAPAPAPAPAK